MKEILSVINQKGGVGKSTTAAALAAGLKRRGFRVLALDLDNQANLSFIMGETAPRLSALDVLTGDCTADEAIRHTPQGDLIPASPALINADRVITETGKEYRLREALEPIRSKYDYVVIDTPPTLGILTVNALTACDSVLIPAHADAFSLAGIGALAQTIDAVRRYCNRSLTVRGIVLTEYSPRAILSRDMSMLIDQTAAQLKTKLCKTSIRRCIAIQESQAVQQSIFDYAPKSNAAADYDALISELLD